MSLSDFLERPCKEPSDKTVARKNVTRGWRAGAFLNTGHRLEADTTTQTPCDEACAETPEAQVVRQSERNSLQALPEWRRGVLR
jgi:hypothetical protein